MIKHRRGLAERKAARWRAGVIDEAKQTPARRRFLDVPAISRKRKREEAEARSVVVHDKAFRRQRKERRDHEEAPTCFADSGLCDVEMYHNRRMSGVCPEDVDNLTFRWLDFVNKHATVDGEWKAPVGQVRGGTGLHAYFPVSHTPHSLHRWLIKQCRIEVWSDMAEAADDTRRPDDYRCFACGCNTAVKTTRFTLLCTNCGASKPRVKRCDMNMKELESVQDVSPSYKRNNHMHEWITRVQALERKVVPREIKQAVLHSFEKWGFDRTKPTLALVRKFLRASGYQRYFEHAPQIMQWLSGKKQVVFDDSTVRRIKSVFAQIQGPFERHKPPSRKNFLSYAYVLYKVCELLELDDILHAFPLLKSRSNLMKADMIWKAICEECGFEFIPTT